ncbi:15592_t:CDS:1, partial [Acaulospora colombiana]
MLKEGCQDLEGTGQGLCLVSFVVGSGKSFRANGYSIWIYIWWNSLDSQGMTSRKPLSSRRWVSVESVNLTHKFSWIPTQSRS